MHRGDALVEVEGVGVRWKRLQEIEGMIVSGDPGSSVSLKFKTAHARPAATEVWTCSSMQSNLKNGTDNGNGTSKGTDGTGAGASRTRTSEALEDVGSVCSPGSSQEMYEVSIMRGGKRGGFGFVIVCAVTRRQQT